MLLGVFSSYLLLVVIVCVTELLLFPAFFISWYLLGKRYAGMFGNKITLAEVAVPVIGELHGIAGSLMLVLYYGYKFGDDPMALLILLPWSGPAMGIDMLALQIAGSWGCVIAITIHIAMLIVMPKVFMKGIQSGERRLEISD
ncbi:MAG: hypothetical protein PHT33_10185 [bacterium]|nr:hypothetical protein [bacterium]